MSHFPNGVIFNNSNKRVGNSKRKFNPSENISSTFTVDKSKNSNSMDCGIVVSDIKSGINITRACSKQSSSNCDVPQSNASTDGLNQYKKETEESKYNSYLDDDENESWFQDCVGAVVAKCTQVEAEVGNEILQKGAQGISEGEFNSGSSRSNYTSKLLQTKPNCKPQSLRNGFYSSSPRLNKITSLRRSPRGSDWPSSYNSSQSSEQKFLAFSSRTETKSVENTSLDESKIEIEKLQKEFKKLEEKYQTRESRMLRPNLEQAKAETHKQKQGYEIEKSKTSSCYDKDNHSLKSQFQSEIRMLRPNLEQAKTETHKQKQEYEIEKSKATRLYENNIHSIKSQFQSEKMGIVVARSQLIHSVEPPRHHLKPIRQFPNKWPLSPNKLSRSGKETETQQTKNVLTQSDPIEICGSFQSCQLLLHLLTPEFFKKTCPETLTLDPPMFSSNSVMKSNRTSMNEKGANGRTHPSSTGKGMSLSTTCQTLEPCYQPLIELTKMLDLSNDDAQEIFLKVIIESLKILEELLLRLTSSTLQDHFMDREKYICKNWQAYVPLNRDYDLFDHRPWYEEEKGVDARRCLGLLSILIRLSTFVLDTILPADCSNAQEDEEDVIEDERMLTDEEDNNQVGKTSTILYIIDKIVKEIGDQRRTMVFEGVLTGVMQLILAIAKSEQELSKDSQQVILEIMKKVLFTRPGSTVLLKVFQFLLEALRYPSISNEICALTARNTCIEDYWEITFTSDSCILQMLCILTRQLPEDFRYKLADAFVSWGNALFVIDESPSWLYVPHDNTRCLCRSLISQLTVTLLCDVCKKYEKGVIKDKKILEKVLPTGLFLIQNLVYQDEHFPVNVGEYRGQLYLFLVAMNSFKNIVHFDPVVCNLLDKLTYDEESRDFKTSFEETEELNSLLSSVYLNNNESL